MTWTEDHPWTCCIVACAILFWGILLHFAKMGVYDIGLFLITIIMSWGSLIVLTSVLQLHEQYKTKKEVEQDA